MDEADVPTKAGHPCPGNPQNSRRVVRVTMATIFIYACGNCERNGKRRGGACDAINLIDVRERRCVTEKSEKKRPPASAGPESYRFIW